jgi:Cu/Zn superoxide dismutase
MEKLKILLLAVVSSSLLISCGDDDVDAPVPTGNSQLYDLVEIGASGVEGEAEFIENDDGSVTITVDMTGTLEGIQHPAHIHFNTAAEGGDIALTLVPVDGSTGESSTTVTEFDDGSALTYENLLDYDGYINVHLSADELATIVAQGDIGQNDLTETSTAYPLSSLASPGINGDVTFTERVNGEALAVIQLAGTPENGVHPAHIHMNAAAEGGGIVFTFNPVNGSTGMSMTNVAELDDGTAFTYNDVTTYDGYVNVHLSEDELATIVAQGDIGDNALTGEAITYALEERAVPGISGTITFSERVNGEAMAEIDLTGTPAGGEHPAHIHTNSAEEGGGVVLTFTPVDGDTGESVTNVSALNDGTTFGYADVLSYDGYVNVHLSEDQISTIVAQGNIGANASN